MSIIWQYLDKRAATIKALKDYGSMRYIIENTKSEIDRVHEKMGRIRSPGFDGMPHSHNPQSGEDRLIKGIDEIDVLKERYRQASGHHGGYRHPGRASAPRGRLCGHEDPRAQLSGEGQSW